MLPYKPSVEAENAGELSFKHSSSRSFKATLRTASEPETPVEREKSSRWKTQTGLQSALSISPDEIDALALHSTMCAQVRRHVTKRA